MTTLPRLPKKWRHCERGKGAAVMRFMRHVGSMSVGEIAGKTGLSLWNAMTVCQSLVESGKLRRIRETLRKPVEHRAFETVHPVVLDWDESNENSRGNCE